MKFIKVKNYRNWQYSKSKMPCEEIVQIDQIATITVEGNGYYCMCLSGHAGSLQIDNNDAQRIFREIGVSL